MDNNRLEEIERLVEEVANDNTAIVDSLNRVLDGQERARTSLVREFDLLRDELAGALNYRVLKDLCRELISPLNAMETMLAQADFDDSATIRAHVNSLANTLHNVLSRMSAEKILISVGEEILDPNRHQCVGLIVPEESPFPSAPPRTIVRMIEDGYTLGGKVLIPARVEIQADRAKSKGI